MNYLQDVIHKISVNYRQIPRKLIDAEIDGKDCFVLSRQNKVISTSPVQGGHLSTNHSNAQQTHSLVILF